MPEFFLSTDMVDEKSRNAFWQEVSKLIYEVSPADENIDTELIGTIRSRLFDSMVLGDTTFNEQICRRTPEMIARTDLDICLLQLVLSGEYTGDFDGTNVYVQPGDMFFMDLTKVLDSRKEAGSRVTLAIPRFEINKWFPAKDLHGLVLPRNVNINQVLFDFILSLDGALDFVQENEIPGIKEALVLLLVAAVDGVALSPAQSSAIDQSMRQRVMDYIDLNIRDQRLSPKTIMAHFKLSHSHLYRQFDQDDGITKLIRQKRLDLAYRYLIHSKGRAETLKEIAYKCGFSDRAQFTRLFKDRYDVSPQDLRELKQVPGHDPMSASNLHQHIQDHLARIQPAKS
ncbi:helix-turn-helix domain-containing protein [Ochrobactrum sp. RH2CCR150]|uniref:helix-turn-helix domain-containing protein n=1 Tax=Ochrobactrum sp. RH2CCR150 TaxID=2587044 RepID=UPI0015FDD2AF|nr:AraC-like DNA-binding protein [Ochrobactrum sp. RH2CCR150]